MMNNGFSNWAKWRGRNGLDDIELPGVYAIALSEQDISGTSFEWRREVIYVGMTNSKGGLKSRLQRFENTIKGGKGHGGDSRVRYKHPDHERLIPRLYVSVWPKACNVLSNQPSDLRAMGEVAKLEYECFAHFVEAFHQLPEFNDKKRSPKK
ncbi:MAG: hypothetical protein HZA00_09890 [Nitrospinae bacterium]|nr:hypothetical protein [Nitrospinota bacterium]